MGNQAVEKCATILSFFLVIICFPLSLFLTFTVSICFLIIDKKHYS